MAIDNACAVMAEPNPLPHDPEEASRIWNRRRTSLYPDPPAGFRPLPVVLRVPSRVPAWLARFAHLAARDPWLQLRVMLDPGLAAPKPGEVRVGALTRFCLRTEHRLRRPNRGQEALAMVDMKAICEDVGRATPGEIHGAEVTLIFGVPAAGSGMASPAHGERWLFGASLSDPEFAGICLLPAMLDPQSTVEVALQLNDGNGDVPLARAKGVGSADSFALLRERAFRKLPALLLRSLRRRAMVSQAAAPAPATDAWLELRPLSSPIACGARILARVSRRLLSRKIAYRGRHPGEPWLIALRESERPLQPAAPCFGHLRPLPAPAGIRWADPCAFEHAGKRYIFVEEFADLPAGGMGRGTIAGLHLRDDGEVVRLGTILDEAWHLSYPQVFEWEGATYMTVESAEVRRVSLLRLREFPDKWEYINDLIVEQNCVDATLFEHEGHWYLFASAAEAGSGSGEELFLFTAPTPLGPFQPHPANPIVSDATCARPAGRIFRHEGKLYRPAQNCGPSYGAGIAFQEITRLDREGYAERTAGRLQPSAPGIDGCHTYSRSHGVEVLDIRDRRAPRPPVAAPSAG